MDTFLTVFLGYSNEGDYNLLDM